MTKCVGDKFKILVTVLVTNFKSPTSLQPSVMGVTRCINPGLRFNPNSKK